MDLNEQRGHCSGYSERNSNLSLACYGIVIRVLGVRNKRPLSRPKYTAEDQITDTRHCSRREMLQTTHLLCIFNAYTICVCIHKWSIERIRRFLFRLFVHFSFVRKKNINNQGKMSHFSLPIRKIWRMKMKRSRSWYELDTDQVKVNANNEYIHLSS